MSEENINYDYDYIIAPLMSLFRSNLSAIRNLTMFDELPQGAYAYYPKYEKTRYERNKQFRSKNSWIKVMKS